MSVSVTIVIEAAEGKADELRQRLIENLEQTRAFAGNELISLVQPREQPGQLLLIERWARLEDFHAYKAWRHETNTSVLAGDLVAGPPQVTIGDVLF